jgi:hypothetical protein
MHTILALLLALSGMSGCWSDREKELESISERQKDLFGSFLGGKLDEVTFRAKMAVLSKREMEIFYKELNPFGIEKPTDEIHEAADGIFGEKVADIASAADPEDTPLDLEQDSRELQQAVADIFGEKVAEEAEELQLAVEDIFDEKVAEKAKEAAEVDTGDGTWDCVDPLQNLVECKTPHFGYGVAKVMKAALCAITLGIMPGCADNPNPELNSGTIYDR